METMDTRTETSIVFFHNRLTMTIAVLGISLAALGGARNADACSAPPCWPGALVPANDTTVPANLPAIYWRSSRENIGDFLPNPTNVSLVEVDSSSAAVPLHAVSLQNGDHLLMIGEVLTPGKNYRLVDTTTCSFGHPDGIHVTFQATDAATFPGSLGEIVVSNEGIRTINIGTYSGSCSTSIEADVASIEVELSEEAELWRDVLHFSTYVDGQLWWTSHSILASHAPGSSWIGRGRDRLYRICDSNDDWAFSGLSAGTHEIIVEATLPGTTIKLTTAPTTVTLSCDNETIPEPDGGTSKDAQEKADSSNKPTEDSTGCSCSVTTSETSSGLEPTLLLFGALFLLRRWRRREAEGPLALTFVG